MLSSHITELGNEAKLAKLMEQMDKFSELASSRPSSCVQRYEYDD